MGRVLRRLRPSPALVVASIALAVSLGGVSYAAVKLPRNSVGALQLRNNAVNSAKIRNRSLKGIDFARGVVRQGKRGLAGPQGAPGAPGGQGPQGPAGAGIGSACATGSAIRAVAANGTVTCQPDANTTYSAAAPLALSGTTLSLPAASDTSSGYLSAADHASFTGAHTFSRSFALNANRTLSISGGGVTNTVNVSIPDSANLHELMLSWEAEWSGGSASTPKTLTCELWLDGTRIASRHSTNAGGYSDVAVSARADVTPGSHEVESQCEVDTASATIGGANLNLVATE
jgi:hypothetical protein